MVFLVKDELQESQRKRWRSRQLLAFASLVVLFQQVMKTSSLWVAVNPLLSGEVLSLLQFGNSSRMFSQFEVLIPLSCVSASRFHCSPLFPSQGSGFHMSSPNGVWPARATAPGSERKPPFLLLETAEMHTGTESQWHRVHPFALLEVRRVDSKPSLCVLPGHSPEGLAAKPGECPAVGSKPPSSPSMPAGCYAGSPGASAMLQRSCALDEGSADSSSWVQYRNIFLKLKRKREQTGRRG